MNLVLTATMGGYATIARQEFDAAAGGFYMARVDHPAFGPAEYLDFRAELTGADLAHRLDALEARVLRAAILG